MGMRQTKVVRQLDDSFLKLCEQYGVSGNLLCALTDVLTKGDTVREDVKGILTRILEQNREIGEQLKTLGICIDLLGGKKALREEDRIQIYSGTRNELKRQGIKIRSTRHG